MSLLPTFIGGGVVDSDYQGNVSVILTNFSSSDVEVNVGDHQIVQIMFIKPVPVYFEEVKISVIQQFEVLKVLVQLANNIFYFFKLKKNLIMPILQNDIDFDFTNSTTEEKKQLIIKLLNKQK